MPLTYKDRGTSGTHLEVRIGDLAIGSLKMDFKSSMSGDDETWLWSLYVGTHPGSLLPGYRTYGSGKSREAAQEELEAMWALWLSASGLRQD